MVLLILALVSNVISLSWCFLLQARLDLFFWMVWILIRFFILLVYKLVHILLVLHFFTDLVILIILIRKEY